MRARRQQVRFGALLCVLIGPVAGAAQAATPAAGPSPLAPIGAMHGFPAGPDRSAPVPAAASPDIGIDTADASADPGVAANDDAERAEAASLLLHMSEALRTLTYSGTFVHAAGDSLNSMAILHTFVDGGELERLSALDGEAREVFRDRSLVTCIWPDTQSVLVTTAKPRSPIAMVDASLADETLYALSLGPDDRVAGRATRQVHVMPRDALRYGYRFWIDRERHMLLRSMLLDALGRPIEQVLFTRIDYPDAIARERFEIRAGGARQSWLTDLPDDVGSAGSAPAAGSDVLAGDPAGAPTAGLDGVADADGAPGDRIDFDGLPMGYREVSERLSTMPMGSGAVSHVMLSDGMASVSVYVEHDVDPDGARESDLSGAVGHSRMGAVNAFGLARGEAMITAVGEVPAETVERIAQAVRVRP